MIKIKLQLFGGGGLTGSKGAETTTYDAKIPDATTEETQLLGNQMNYANTQQNNANTLANATANQINNNSVNTDWQNLYDTAQNQTNANQTQANSLSSGVLPSEYSTNRQNALNADLQGTVGNMISGLGNRGVLNSTTTDSAMNNISQNAANTLANNYTTDMNTASNLVSNNQNIASQGLTNATNAQKGSLVQPTAYSSLATSANEPTSTLLTNLRNARYSVASPGGTVVQQGNGGLISGLASAAAKYYTAGA
jgi:hypothetical protein